MSIQQVTTEEVTRGLRPTQSGGVSPEDPRAVCGFWTIVGVDAERGAPREEAPATVQVEGDSGLDQSVAWGWGKW